MDEGWKRSKTGTQLDSSEGTCKIDQPSISWNDNITKDSENIGVKWEEAFLLMTNGWTVRQTESIMALHSKLC